MLGRRVTATATVASVTAAASLALFLFGYAQEAAYGLGFIPKRVSVEILPPELSSLPIWLTPIGATLIQNPINLFFSMMILLFIGARTEEAIGSWRTVLLYGVGAYAAALAYWIEAPQSLLPMFGAYAPTSALIGAYAILYQRPGPRRTVSERVIQAGWLTAAWSAITIATHLNPAGRGLIPGWTGNIGAFVAGLALAIPLLRWHQRRSGQRWN